MVRICRQNTTRDVLYVHVCKVTTQFTCCRCVVWVRFTRSGRPPGANSMRRPPNTTSTITLQQSSRWWVNISLLIAHIVSLLLVSLCYVRTKRSGRPPGSNSRHRPPNATSLREIICSVSCALCAAAVLLLFDAFVGCDLLGACCFGWVFYERSWIGVSHD